MPDLAEPLGPTARALTEQRVNGARISSIGYTLPGYLDHEIGITTVVRISGYQRRPEGVPRTGSCVVHAHITLVKYLVASRIQLAAALAVNHVDRARIGNGPHRLPRYSDRQVVLPVAVEISSGERSFEEVIGFDRTFDVGRPLCPQLVTGDGDGIGRVSVEYIYRANVTGGPQSSPGTPIARSALPSSLKSPTAREDPK